MCGHPGLRENIATADLESVLTEELEEEVRQAAEISMGTEVRCWTITSLSPCKLLAPLQISEGDMANITHLCDQVSLALHLIGTREVFRGWQED